MSYNRIQLLNVKRLLDWAANKAKERGAQEVTLSYLTNSQNNWSFVEFRSGERESAEEFCGLLLMTKIEGGDASSFEYKIVRSSKYRNVVPAVRFKVTDKAIEYGRTKAW